VRILVSAAFAVLALIALAVTGEKTVRTTVIIKAPAPLVWSVLTDSERYSEWNPMYVHAEGTYRVGETLVYERKGAAGERTTLQFTIREAREEEVLHQQGGTPFLFTYDHRWVLEPYDGGTRATQIEVLRGLGVWFWNPTYLKTPYVDVNTALDARVRDLQKPVPPS